MENSASPALQASASDNGGAVLGTTPIGQIGASLMPPGGDAYSGIFYSFFKLIFMKAI